MTEILITFLTTLGVTLGREWVRNRHVQRVAKQILESEDHPTTDPAQAVREAWVLAHHQVIAAQVEHMKRAAAAGDIRVRQGVAKNAAVFRGVDAEVIARDGSEPWQDGWPK